MKPSSNCVFHTQDENYNTISQMKCYDEKEDCSSKGTHIRYVRIPDGLMRFRLVLLTDGKPAYIPTAIKIEQSG
jgi:hypothetical protein